MPLDDTTAAAGFLAAADPEALYRRRREEAAALWRSVPREVFNLGHWGGCGTTACALGWLANRRHDGWRRDYRRGVLPVRESEGEATRDVMIDAARYFGTTVDQAGALFSGDPEPYGVEQPWQVTPAQVADALSALPVTAKEGR